MAVKNIFPALGFEGTATYPIVQCPHCRSWSVRWSRLKIRDVIRLLTLMRPVRCRSCYTRFYRSRWEKVRVIPSPSNTTRLPEASQKMRN